MSDKYRNPASRAQARVGQLNRQWQPTMLMDSSNNDGRDNGGNNKNPGYQYQGLKKKGGFDEEPNTYGDDTKTGTDSSTADQNTGKTGMDQMAEQEFGGDEVARKQNSGQGTSEAIEGKDVAAGDSKAQAKETSSVQERSMIGIKSEQDLDK